MWNFLCVKLSLYHIWSQDRFLLFIPSVIFGQKTTVEMLENGFVLGFVSLGEIGRKCIALLCSLCQGHS